MADILFLTKRAGLFSELVRGVRSYIEQHALEWRLRVLTVDEAERFCRKRDTQFDGIIGQIKGDAEYKLVSRLKLPTATIGRYPPGIAALAQVAFDDDAIGQVAADYAARCGCGQLALIGSWDISGTLFTAAAARAESLGLRVLRYQRRNEDFPTADGKVVDLMHWLGAQPQPMLAFLHHDGSARWFCELCVDAGIAVPESVAVLGVGDDPWVCERTQPALSSISIPWRLGGHLLALQMHRLLSGTTPSVVSIPPLDVTTRASSKLRGSDDHMVQQIMQSLIENMANGPRIQDLSANFECSRQTIFRRFKAAIGQNLEQWWLDQRLQHSVDLLASSSDRIASIAQRSGFLNAESFRQAFSKRYGHSPSLFRRLARN